MVPLWKTAWSFLKKLNIVLTWCSILTLHQEELKRSLHNGVQSYIIHNSQKVEELVSSRDGGINKMWYIHTMEYHSALKI
jgi:hypothetical protein